uniref:Odorant-binding protein 27 n=1 Tax=Adelphocoris lineolatus TaxID=236346 RepID=A0A346RVH2_ADELI|nr:odorant-binding protein 27 [Adelphocoris lineolatus]
MSSDMANILLLLVIGAGIAVNEGDASMEALMECKKDYKVSREQIMSGDSSEEVKCFAECLMKKTGGMDEGGNFNTEKIKEEGRKHAKTDDQKRANDAAVDKCISETEAANPTGKCEKGFEFFKCVRGEMKSPM